MSRDTERGSPGQVYAQSKGLTRRRSRTALMIDAFLIRSEGVFLSLMNVDEARMRRVTEPWVLSSTQQGFKPPVQIGRHALLAYPGCMIESLDESDAARRGHKRLLIKAAEAGVIFHIVGTAGIGGMDWNMTSIEAVEGKIRDECLKRLMDRSKHLVREEIPAVLSRVAALPTAVG